MPNIKKAEKEDKYLLFHISEMKSLKYRKKHHG